MHGDGFDSHHLEPSLYVEDWRLQAVRLGLYAFAVNGGVRVSISLPSALAAPAG